MKNKAGKLLMILMASLVLGACSELNEDRVNSNAQLQVRMTDAPGDYEAVFIEIEDVLIHRGDGESAGEAGWESVEGVRRGTYNLLDLVNGHDTLLVDANVSPGHLGHLRLVLGAGNRVVAGGKEYELQTPDTTQAGVELRIGTELEEDLVYEVLLDFDAARSIVKLPDSGGYRLDPTVRVLDADPSGGTLRGVVSPSGTNTAVFTINNEDTLGTYTDTLGNYMLKGIPPGNYSMLFMPDSTSGFLPLDTGDIAINDGEVSQLNISLPRSQP